MVRRPGIGAGSIIKSMVSCDGCLSLERTLDIRRGLNVLLSGKPDELVVLSVSERLLAKSTMSAWPVDLALRPSGASSGELWARLLFWRSCVWIMSRNRPCG